MAGTVIGVSHLVQSTRAGADFGFQLLVIILLVNLFKYPFFEIGHRYAAATGESLLDGYKRLGSFYLILFFGLIFIVSIVSVAGVTFVAAIIAKALFPVAINAQWFSLIIMVICLSIIVFGHYHRLELVMKIIIAILLVSTVLAFCLAFKHGPVAPNFVSPSPWTWASLPFIIALMGWMPGPIEVSVFQSLWITAKSEYQHKGVSLKDARIDFNIGYFITVLLAVIFLALGAYIMHGSNDNFSNSGAQFALQLISVYTKTLGSWSYYVIGIAAFTTIFSTTLTVIDAYPRAVSMSFRLAFNIKKIKANTLHVLWMLFFCATALFVIWQLSHKFKTFIDIATTIAFLAGPLFAFLNYRLITSKFTPKHAQPGKMFRLLSWLGLLFLTGFALVYLYSLFF